MRVAILAPSAVEAPEARELGPPRAIRSYARALAQVEHNDVVALRVRLTPCDTVTSEVDGLPVIRCWVGRIGTVLRKLDPEVLHTFSTTATSLAGVRTGLASRRRGIIWIDSILGLERIETKYGYPHAPQSAVFEQLRLANADCVVFPSKFALREATERHGKRAWRDARIIPLGIDHEWFERGAWFDRTPATSTGMTALSVVSVGAIAPHKGQDVLLRAFKESDVKGVLHLVGPELSQSFARDLRAAADRIGTAKRVVFSGFLTHDQTAEALLNANVFALLSRFDLFPAAVLEAMAVGHAPVVTPAVGSGELVVHMRSGYVVEDDLAAARILETIVEDESAHRERGGAAREIIRQFEWSGVVRSYGALYEEMLCRRRNTLAGGTGRHAE